MKYCFECHLPVEGSCKRHPGAKIMDGGTPSRRPGRYVRHESQHGNPVVCGRTMLLAADGQVDETWQAGVDLALELGLSPEPSVDDETMFRLGGGDWSMTAPTEMLGTLIQAGWVVESPLRDFGHERRTASVRLFGAAWHEATPELMAKYGELEILAEAE